MHDVQNLYGQVILDHNRNPRNFRVLEPCDHKAEGFNPLCGDHITVYLNREGDRIVDIAFTGNGCAVAKASASLMTAALKGKTVREAKELFTRFHQMVTSEPGAPVDEAGLGKLRVLGGIREYPVRIKCATLAWHTMASALDGKQDPVSTE